MPRALGHSECPKTGEGYSFVPFSRTRYVDWNQSMDFN